MVLVVSLLIQTGASEASAASNKSYVSIFEKIRDNFKKYYNYKNEKETTLEKGTEETTEIVTEEETTIDKITEKETTEAEQTTTEKVTEKETTEAEQTTTDKVITEEETTKTQESVSQKETVESEKETTKAEEPTTEKETVKVEESTTEKETAKTEEETTEKEEINIYLERYQEVAKNEAEWLWAQQLSNGAFAVHNEYSGTVDVNPYFAEIVAISLINYDSSAAAKAKIEKYFDWHISHINTADEDYNGLAGTIYDYKVKVKNGVVVSETSKGSYDSTDSYSALFVKALGDYAQVYNDGTYLTEHASEIKAIVNVMFATMSSNGYTYAKPDYQIIYLMDNTEVYAGLKAAKYIYENVIDDKEMLKKVTEAVEFYEANFNAHWWKGDHYAAVLNPDYSEYTGYKFSWDMFYPCATAQMFPIMYGLVDADSQYAKTLYNGLCAAWDWQDMDYIAEGVDVFCWGSFAYLGGLMDDDARLNSYLDKYEDIVEAGRKYPLYSAEAAMVLMGCMTMISE